MSRIEHARRLDRQRGAEVAERAIDRRVARTRKALHHALISLIQKKDYEAITIEEICDVANVGRSTFYAHYTSKDDLHRSGIEHLRKALVDRQKEVPAQPSQIGRPRLSFRRRLLTIPREISSWILKMSVNSSSYRLDHSAKSSLTRTNWTLNRNRCPERSTEPSTR